MNGGVWYENPMVQQLIGFAVRLLALNLSFVIERYASPSALSRFAQGLFIGLFISRPVSWRSSYCPPLGMIAFCGFLEWRALLTGQALPGWMFKAR